MTTNPTTNLRGLRTTVLGSTSGIGRATALALAEAGADVIVHGRRSRERAEAVAASVSPPAFKTFASALWAWASW